MDFPFGLVIFNLAHVLLFGLSPDDLPHAPDAATWTPTRIMALSRWIVRCVCYVSRETVESLIQSNSLSLSLVSADLNLSLSVLPLFSDGSSTILV